MRATSRRPSRAALLLLAISAALAFFVAGLIAPTAGSVIPARCLRRAGLRKRLQYLRNALGSGYLASRTIFRSTGLKTNASMSNILSILKN
jgi:hypothetical protein